MSKTNGQVFTPNHIVKQMIELCDIQDITKIKIIDNSCGDGAFLCEIAKQIIQQKPKNLKTILEKNLYGIELDVFAYQQCLKNLQALEKQFNLPIIKWNVVNDNTLEVYQTYSDQFDLVIGNPPYVRIHNTIETLRNFTFCQKGMSDLYIAFYEIGLAMLNPTGKLCFINPSSLFNSKAASDIRKFILEQKILSKVVDFKHQQLFKDFTTYSCVVLLDKTHCKFTTLYSDLKQMGELNQKDFDLNGNWYFDTDIENLKQLKTIIVGNKKNDFKVKNGVATLCDKVLIGDHLKQFKGPFVIDIVKGSTLKETKTLFLYDENFKPLNFDSIPKELKTYLLEHENLLRARALENRSIWWTYGRSQGIKAKNKLKLCINATIKDINSIKVKIVKIGALIYSGLYLEIENEAQGLEIIAKLQTDKFLTYIKSLGKYKAGGYYTFNSKDLELFLNSLAL